MANPNSEQLVAEPEFLQLFVKNEAALRGYARAILPDWDLVDEALQESSVTMWEKRSQLRSTDGFLPWAKVILRYKCLRQLEILRSRRPILGDGVLRELADRAESFPGEISIAREKAVRDCLFRFSVEHRELLLAPHRSTCSVVDLAKQRNKSVNSLYKLIGRLREKLSDCVRAKLLAESQT